MIFYNNITCAETKEEIYRTRKYFKLHVLHFWYYWIHIKLYNSCCNQFHSLGFISLFENPEVALTAHVTQFNVTFSWFSYFIPSARILDCSKIFSKALFSSTQVKSISISYIYTRSASVNFSLQDLPFRNANVFSISTLTLCFLLNLT